LEDGAITQLQQPEVTEMAEQVAQLAERQLTGRRPSRGVISRALRRDDQHSDDPRPDAGQPPAGIGRSLGKSLRRPGGEGRSRTGSLKATDSARRQHPKQTIHTLQAVVSAAVVVGVFAFAVPKIASYGSAWAVVQQLTWTQVALLAIVAAFNLVTYWPRAMAALPGLGFWQAAVRYQTTISVTYTVPAGGVAAVGLSYAMLRSWGFSLAEITLAELLDGIWDVFAKLAMPLAAVALLAATGSHKLSLLVPALIGLAVLAAAVAGFGLLMWRKAYARWLGETLGRAVSWLRRLVHKPAVAGWGEAAVRFRRRSNDLVARRWPALTTATIVSHLGLYLVFLATIRIVGVTPAQVSWAEILAVFSLGRLLSGLTPGGIGVVELTYITGLALAGGAAIRPQAVAATLLFRLLTYGLEIPLGTVTYLIWQRNKSWRKPLHPTAPVAVPAQPA
jgi:putative heme transporter